MAIAIQDQTNAYYWKIDSSGNGQVNLPQTLGNNGAARIVGKFNRGTNYNELEVTPNGSVRVGQDNLLWFSGFPGTNIDTRKYQMTLSTMAAAQAGDYLTLNSGLAVTASAYAVMKTWRTFPFIKNFNTSTAIDVLISSYQNNVTIELGVIKAANNAAPTDGAFFRYSSTTLLQAVVNTGGSEQTVNLTPPTAGLAHKYTIRVSDFGIDFYIDDVYQTTIQAPSGYTFPFLNEWQQIMARIYNASTAPSTAVSLKIGQILVTTRDLNTNRLWATVMAGNNCGSYQNDAGNIAAGQTANYANSAAPSSAVLSNTTASYTTLGGQFQFAAVAGAETDYALFAFLVPTTNKNLVIRGIRIGAFNTGAAVATTATVLQWSLGVASSGVSLATAEGNGTVAPARVPLGVQSFAIGAAIGAVASPIDVNLDAPLYVPSYSYLHVILKVPIGTATASQIIRGLVMINGYFE